MDETDYDIVIGGVANDKVFNTVELYFDRLIDKTEAITRLRYEKPNMQVCFRTQSVLEQYLSFEGSEKVWMQILYCYKKNIAELWSCLLKKQILRGVQR